MEEEKIRTEGEEALAAKKDAWKYSNDMAFNFALHTELTVEITLAEYRDLIRASADRDNERGGRYAAENKVRELEKKIAEMNKEMEESKC